MGKTRQKTRQDKKPERSKDSPRKSLRILNTREKKEINQQIKEQWGCELDKSYVWLLNNKGKLYIADKDIGMLDLSKLKVDKIGMYVCHVSDKGVRLSIEGSQLLGPKAKKNVLVLSEEELPLWMAGKDIDITSEESQGCEGFVILKHMTGETGDAKDATEDFLGCGKLTEKGLLNFLPKTRRILAS